ncbi:MAG: peptide-methionine (S)-S-oxide reductase MsrA [Candidatus Moranbacteria bacterium]|nr:peptide-methionine (S)-S-oxide reductase MsrA [Candidatus Moranbacteria bacterium]
MDNIDAKNNSETIVLGGGCFWCLEAVFLHVKGILEVVSGYAGGSVQLDEKASNYELVSTGKTGHAEVVKIVFDPETISLEDVLHIFFTVHDPTTPNRQGNDVGSQYRSIILCEDKKQFLVAQKVMKEIESAAVWENPIVTEAAMLQRFFPAEDYHQKYFEKNPNQAYCQIVIAPKIAKLRQKYGKLYT